MTQHNLISGTDAATWRLQLLAHLVTERANLLRQMRGINEEMLTNSPVEDEWTAKDILAHVGSWDAFHTERMSLVLSGRINAILELGGQDEIDARNAKIHAFCHDLSLESALAIGLKERGGFLATLARIPDELLHREIELPWGWRTHMRQWAKWRYRHDADHADQLRAWRDQLPPDRKRQIGPIYVLRAILNATRKEFLALANIVPTTDRETLPVCGIWSLKDLVGHLTDWEWVGMTGLRQLTAGKTPRFDEQIDDFDTWNDAHAAARRDQSWDMVWAEFKETRRELLTLVDKMTDDDCKRPFTTPWNTQLNGYSWTMIWTGHEHEHAGDVRLATSN